MMSEGQGFVRRPHGIVGAMLMLKQQQEQQNRDAMLKLAQMGLMPQEQAPQDMGTGIMGMIKRLGGALQAPQDVTQRPVEMAPWNPEMNANRRQQQEIDAATARHAEEIGLKERELEESKARNKSESEATRQRHEENLGVMQGNLELSRERLAFEREKEATDAEAAKLKDILDTLDKEAQRNFEMKKSQLLNPQQMETLTNLIETLEEKAEAAKGTFGPWTDKDRMNYEYYSTRAANARRLLEEAGQMAITGERAGTKTAEQDKAEIAESIISDPGPEPDIAGLEKAAFPASGGTPFTGFGGPPSGDGGSLNIPFLWQQWLNTNPGYKTIKSNMDSTRVR